MNVFKAIGQIINSVTAVITRAAKATENLVEVVEVTTEGMLIETKLEQEEELAKGKAKLAQLRAKLAKQLEESESDSKENKE